jgi:4-carboxymuconolactone decarboxylase
MMNGATMLQSRGAVMRLTSRHVMHTRQLIRVSLILLVFTSVRLGGQPLPDRPGGLRPVALTKPRISPLPEAQFTDEHKQRIAKFLPAGARPGNGFRTLLNVPELVDRTMTFHNYVTQDSSLPPRIRELLVLRTAWLHGSDVIWRERTPFARKAGLTNDELRKIAQGPGAAGWDAFEANLLRMADQLFRNSFVNDSVYKVMAARYNTCNLMDAGVTVADVASSRSCTTRSVSSPMMLLQPIGCQWTSPTGSTCRRAKRLHSRRREWRRLQVRAPTTLARSTCVQSSLRRETAPDT